MEIATLEQRRKELLRDLEVVNRQIEDASKEAFRMKIQAEAILRRFVNGDYIVKSFDRFWWVDANGNLIEWVDQDDIDRLLRLTGDRVIEKTSFVHK